MLIALNILLSALVIVLCVSLALISLKTIGNFGFKDEIINRIIDKIVAILIKVFAVIISMLVIYIGAVFVWGIWKYY